MAISEEPLVVVDDQEMDSPIHVITVIYDKDEDRIRVDIGDLNVWSAASLLGAAADRVGAELDVVELVGFDDGEEDDEEWDDD